MTVFLLLLSLARSRFLSFFRQSIVLLTILIRKDIFSRKC